MINNPFIDHDYLIERGAKWLANCSNMGEHGYRCQVILKEYKSSTLEIPDIIGFAGHQSVVIECKVSRADFMTDQNKEHRKNGCHLGNYRFYLTPPNIVCPEDISENWGLLYVFDNKIVVAKDANIDDSPLVKVEEYKLLYSIIRRCEIRGYLKDIQSLESRATWSK